MPTLQAALTLISCPTIAPTSEPKESHGPARQSPFVHEYFHGPICGATHVHVGGHPARATLELIRTEENVKRIDNLLKC